MKRISRMSFSLVLILAVSCTGLLAQDKSKIDKKYQWSYDLSDNGALELFNYDCDITIHTWDKEELVMELHVIADMKTESNAEALNTYLEELEYDSSPSRTELSTKFWKSRIQIAMRKVIKLERGLSLRYSDLKTRAEIWMPESAKLELKSKYSRIELENLKGKLELDLYNDKLEGRNIGKAADILAKYSEIKLDTCKDISADIYDSDLTISSMGEADFKSKYSKVICGDASGQKIDSYNDKYSYESCGDITMTAKYTDLQSGRAARVNADTYEGSIAIDDCMNMELKAKYTDFTMKSARDIYITSMYEGSLSSSSVSSVSISESKYVKYKLGLLESSFDLREGYEDDIFIDKLSSYFKAIELNGKYLKCETLYNDDLDLKFLAKIKYPHLDTDNIDLRTKIKIKEASDIEYEAYIGKERDNMPLISLSGYEISFKFR